ncbi:Stf0 family sulfotransferase [Microbaculum marinum]|uniref:Stf0 family sulfotransferase n=1 Tax=Microbaculum marinum TaxID=1764581 RepID=A0AAW9RY98_9HYPH
MPFDAYILCGTPRTGSTLLCDMLASTKAAGRPDSYYGRRFIGMWAEEWGLPAPGTLEQAAFEVAYLDAAVAAGRGDTAIFGLRLMKENLHELSEILDRIHPGLASDRSRFERAFGKVLYVHLFREDKLAQAVSYVKAEQTGLWHVAPDGTEIERIGPPRDPKYDFERIRREVVKLESFDAEWSTWFHQQAIEPLRIGYERLAADPAAALLRICEALDIPLPRPGDIRAGVARLADETSLEWMRRYRQDVERAN